MVSIGANMYAERRFEPTDLPIAGETWSRRAPVAGVSFMLLAFQHRDVTPALYFFFFTAVFKRLMKTKTKKCHGKRH